MKKTWLFFKLRLLQLRYDKTALFFCYILPVLLLLGIGYPVEIMNNARVELYLLDEVNSPFTETIKASLAGHELLNTIPAPGGREEMLNQLSAGKVAHFLHFDGADVSDRASGIHLYESDDKTLRTENEAVKSIVDTLVRGGAGSGLAVHRLQAGREGSYIATLLPGLIGMTLLIIGLNGFGGVLIEEKHEGLFKNIKTIDASPVPFLSGLFLSRLLVSYSVALALYLIGIFMFDLSAAVDYVLLTLVLTLSCAAFLGVGLIIAVLSPSVNAFNGIVNFVEIPFLIFSGVFFSISAFPEWLQWFSKMIPLTHVNNALQKIFFDSVSYKNAMNIGVEVLVLLAWCCVTILIGWRKFKW